MTTQESTGGGNRSPRRLPLPVAAVIASSARAVLLSAASLLLWAALPAVWGWTPTTIQSDSMAPAIRAGDVVVAMPVDEDALTPGLDVLVRDPDHPDRLRFHRFVRWTDSGELILKGDANAEPDSSSIPVADVVGIGVIRVPAVGLPIVWLRQGDIIPLALSTLAVGVLFVLSALDPTTPPPLRLRSTRDGRSRLQLRRSDRSGVGLAATVVSIIAVTGISALLPGQSAWAAFGSSSPNPASSLAAASTYECLTATPPSTPWLFYGFAEISGTSANDTSGNARTGTLRNGVTRTEGGCVAGSTPSVTLNGSTGFISTPTAVSSPANYTMEMWFNTTTTRGGRLIGFGNSQTGTSTSTDRHIYMTNAGKLVFGAAPGGTATTISSTASYNDGTWHHVAATLGTTGMKLYVDGTQVAVNTRVTSGRTQTGYFRIGNDTLSGWTSAPTSNYFAGSIDGVGIYGSILTATAIAERGAEGH